MRGAARIPSGQVGRSLATLRAAPREGASFDSPSSLHTVTGWRETAPLEGRTGAGLAPRAVGPERGSPSAARSPAPVLPVGVTAGRRCVLPGLPCDTETGRCTLRTHRSG